MISLKSSLALLAMTTQAWAMPTSHAVDDLGAQLSSRDTNNKDICAWDDCPTGNGTNFDITQYSQTDANGKNVWERWFVRLNDCDQCFKFETGAVGTVNRFNACGRDQSISVDIPAMEVKRFWPYRSSAGHDGGTNEHEYKVVWAGVRGCPASSGLGLVVNVYHLK